MFYIFACKPFTEPIINYVNIYSELTLSIVYLLLPLQGGNMSSSSKNSLDLFMVYLIYTIMVVQVIAPFIILFNKLIKKIKDKRHKVYPIKDQVICNNPNAQESEKKDQVICINPYTQESERKMQSYQNINIT